MEAKAAEGGDRSTADEPPASSHHLSSVAPTDSTIASTITHNSKYSLEEILSGGSSGEDSDSPMVLIAEIAKQMKKRNALYVEDLQVRNLATKSFSERNRQQYITIVCSRLQENEDALDRLESDACFDKLNPSRRVKRLRNNIDGDEGELRKLRAL